MHRRELLRAAGWLGLLSAVPVCGCASTADRSDRGSASTARPLSPSTGAFRPGVAEVAGGRLVQAGLHRQTPPAAAEVRNKLLPVSAALYRAALTGTANAVLSPYSIGTALGMLAFGARGETAEQLARVLGGDAATVARWLTGIDAALARSVTGSRTGSFGTPTPAVVDPANAVFVGSYPVRPAYLDALATGYGAGIRQVDFADADPAIAAMNDWVDRCTHGLIPHLIPPRFVDASTVLVLINALYLKAAWANPFDPGTPKMPFHTLTGAVAVPFLTRSDKMLYASGAGWQAVSVPLWAGLAMTVIVPDAGRFRQVSAGLDSGLLAAATSGQERQVELAMPAFTTDLHTDLEPPLKTLGLGELFGGPDLSGIADGPLRVSGAVHQARIAVDDKGIEAAAATAIAVPMSGAPPAPPVRLDRPFLYLVHDVETTTPLFLGRVTDPTA